MHMHAFGGNDADLVSLGVKLLESVARAHAFLDGNKRVGFYTAAAFPDINGCVFAPPDEEKVSKWVEQLATHEIDAPRLTDLLRPYIVTPPSQEKSSERGPEDAYAFVQ